MRIQVKLVILLYVLTSISCSKKADYNVMDYGAVSNGIMMNTEAIQKAINECHQNGGGKVVIPKGTFLSGTLYMKDNVNLHIEAGAILKGSFSFDDYPDNPVKYVNSFSYPNGKLFENKALIFGEGVSNIAITGQGVIDGSGDSPSFQLGNDSNPESRKRPCMLLFIDCKNIRVYDLHLRNSAYWLQNYLGCDSLHLKCLTIYNHTNFNQDATDIDADNVLIEDCIIDADDDGICLKSHNADHIVENITVRNCTISTNCNAVKFGTKSEGGFKNISVSNCIIKKASEDHLRKWQENLEFIELPTTVLTGFALESVDGGIIENINISDIQMQDVQTPIFVIMGRRNIGQAGNPDFYKAREKALDSTLRAGSVSNLTFRNITAKSHSKMTSSITAAEGYYVENVILENVKISTMGYGTREDATIPLREYNGSYPENRMYGFAYPSSGFFFRHVKNLTLNTIDLEVRNEDYRPAIIFDDVHDVKLETISGNAPAGNQALIRVEKSLGIQISNTQSDTNVLIEYRGTNKKEVTIIQKCE
ncbi:Exo-poly-alpha-D-galacturonosidase [termite gut metagenome]|uniref:Exo-poly-alpha-D-galacturonosidase n=1 Tax=termite gut metagenome TaxID=433724 RepID=A0A5J4R6H3_9ZZZZ